MDAFRICTKRKIVKVRYALRNKAKIEKYLGRKFLKDLLESLDSFIEKKVGENLHNLELSPTKYKGKSFNAIEVESSSEDLIHIFIVVGITYDVYKLAYFKTKDK